MEKARAGPRKGPLEESLNAVVLVLDKDEVVHDNNGGFDQLTHELLDVVVEIG